MDYAEASGVRPPVDPQFRPPGNAPREGGVPGGSSVSPKPGFWPGSHFDASERFARYANLQIVTGHCTWRGAGNKDQARRHTGSGRKRGWSRHKRHAVFGVPRICALIRARRRPPLHRKLINQITLQPPWECERRRVSLEGMARKWPTSLPPLPPEAAGPVRFFQPPPNYDPTAPPTPSPQPAWLPLPLHFRVDPDPSPSRPLEALQRALRRHRLLFLWYAHPRHVDVPADLTPDKGDLYDRLNLPHDGITIPAPADRAFEFETAIEAWLREQQDALGRGPKGKRKRPINPPEFPTGYYAYWEFPPDVETPMHESYLQIVRLVGAALQPPRRDWIGDDDVPLIRECDSVARPAVADPTTGSSWQDHPIIAWDYPDRLARQIERMERLVLMERGASPTAATDVAPTAATPPVVLHGQGQKPLVLGREMPVLSDARYLAVQALVKAWPEGLTKQQLENQTESTSARKTLKALHDADPQWAAVIQLPGKAGMRYRIAYPDRQ